MERLEQFLEDSSDEDFNSLFIHPTCSMLELRYVTVFESSVHDGSGNLVANDLVVAQVQPILVNGLNKWVANGEEKKEMPVLIKNPANDLTPDFYKKYGAKNAIVADDVSGFVFAGRIQDASMTVVRPVAGPSQAYFQEMLSGITYNIPTK